MRIVVTRTVTYEQVIEVNVEGVTDIEEAIDEAIDNADPDDGTIVYENWNGYLA